MSKVIRAALMSVAFFVVSVACGAPMRGINIGAALEAPSEGDWSVRIERTDLVNISRSGFNLVRIPIRWSSHISAAPTYKIDDNFIRRVDEVVGWAFESHLKVIIDVHHFENAGDEQSLQKLLAVWKQLAQRFAHVSPDLLYFELLNEPHGKLSVERWNEWLGSIVREIRGIDTRRALIVGGAMFNSGEALRRLRLPRDDHIILTFHYYEPLKFTHQGTPWNPASKSWAGTEWSGSPLERSRIKRDFRSFRSYADALGVSRILLGEFGVYQTADARSRAKWVSAVRQAAECNGMDWAYWDLRAGFGAFDPKARLWRDGLERALLGGNDEECANRPIWH